VAKLCLSFKGRPIAVHYFDDTTEVITIGRSPNCTLVIDSLAVAPIHAKIAPNQAGGHVISVTNELPTRVNHHPITEHLLSHGDMIQIGKHTLTFAEDGQTFGTLTTAEPVKSRIIKLPPVTPAFNKQTNGPSLLHKEPNLKGISDKDFAAVEQQSQLKTCIQIINGKHFGKVISIEGGLTRLGVDGLATAAIAHRRDGYFLSHLEGSKPPCINGHSIKEHSQQLFDGDRVQIGNIRMIFHHQSASTRSEIAADA